MAVSGSGGFKLVIKDDRLAAWMAINNTFTKSPATEWDDRTAEHGYLIQLGKFRRWPDGMIMDAVRQVTFSEGGPIRKDQLEDPTSVWWIDIHRPGKHPMTVEHLEALRLAPPHSLHKYLVPYPGGITIWPGERIDIRTELHDSNDTHVSHTFTLEGPVEVDVYNCQDRVQIPSNQTDITIEYEDKRPGPGQDDNPPMYP